MVVAADEVAAYDYCRFLEGRSDQWLEKLQQQLEAVPGAGLGEVLPPSSSFPAVTLPY